MTWGRASAARRAATLAAAFGMLLSGCSLAQDAPARAPVASPTPTRERPFRTAAALVDAVETAAVAARTAGVTGTVTTRSLGRMAFNGDTEVGDRPERDVYLSTKSRHLNLVTVEDVSYVIDEKSFWHRVADAQIRPLTDLFMPEGQFASLRGGGRELVSHGEVTLDMRPATHYSVVVDVRAAFAERGVAPTGRLPATTTWEVWVDADDLLRKVTFTLGDTAVTANYPVWGHGDLDLDPPDPGWVLDDRPAWLLDLTT